MKTRNYIVVPATAFKMPIFGRSLNVCEHCFMGSHGCMMWPDDRLERGGGEKEDHEVRMILNKKKGELNGSDWVFGLWTWLARASPQNGHHSNHLFQLN